MMKTRPDVRVLFADIEMPRPLDGMKLARKINEQWPNVQSSSPRGKWPAKADIAGHGHFAKPYRTQDVINEINALAREAER